MPEDMGGGGGGVSKNHVKAKGGGGSAKFNHGIFCIAPAPLLINNDQSLTPSSDHYALCGKNNRGFDPA